MIIQHNIMSLNAHRQLGGNTSLVSKNLEKLSSGFKINRAGDDAAGLAISEKMRSQITGLTRAQSNAQDGISLVQTAEGALTEVHSMLNRMVDLATQSSNGTMQGDDRQKIQDEMNSLTSEIDRISQSTNFNGIKLLDGTMGTGGAGAAITVTGTSNATAVTSQATAAKGIVYTAGAFTQGGTTGNIDSAVAVAYTKADGTTGTKDIAFKSGTSAADSFNAFKAAFEADAAVKDLFTVGGSAAGITFTPKTGNEANGVAVTNLTVKTAGTDTIAIAAGGASTPAVAAGKSYDLSGWKTGDALTIQGKEYKFDTNLAKLQTALDADGITADTANAAAVTFTAKAGAAGAGLVLQIGDTADAFNKVTVSVEDMGKVGLKIDAIDVTKQTPASDAIKVINAAIEKVSKNRSAMGALQNRLEHTINNLGVATENMTAAESRVRDVDMAKEMANFTKNNVLTQAAQAMLAQANQQPQQVLQLLR